MKSFSLDEGLESLLESSDKSLVLISCNLLSIERLGSSITNWGLVIELKIFLGENLINTVRELSPFNVSTFFGSLEVASQLPELVIR